MFDTITTTQDAQRVTLDYSRVYDYKTIKAELQAHGYKCRHFTKTFLQMYAKARQAVAINDAAGVDTRYYDGRIATRREYDEIRQTAFYRLESCAYCTFLQIAHEAEEKALEKALACMEGGF